MSTIVMGDKLEPFSDFWHTLTDSPCEGMWEKMKEGRFVWSNLSGLSRDFMLLYRLAAKQEIAGLLRVRMITTLDMHHPDLAWMDNKASILERLGNFGQLFQPERAKAADVKVQMHGDDVVLVSGKRYKRYQDINDQWKTEDLGEYHDTYQILPVTKTWADAWENKTLQDTKQAVERAVEIALRPDAEGWYRDDPKRNLSKFHRRAAFLYNLWPQEWLDKWNNTETNANLAIA